MRPSQEDMVETVRISLRDTVLPAVEDRWARYVAQAMDLVLQHVQLRISGEAGALAGDSADMAATLAEVVALAAGTGRDADAAQAARWATFPAATPPAPPVTASTAQATTLNEQLRSHVVAVLGWLDENEASLDPTAAATLRDIVHRLVRRQTDRMTTMVEPLFMSFGPVAS